MGCKKLLRFVNPSIQNQALASKVSKTGAQWSTDHGEGYGERLDRRHARGSADRMPTQPTAFDGTGPGNTVRVVRSGVRSRDN